MSNAQSKLDQMRGWGARRLEAALPSWAKARLAAHRAFNRPFKPDLRMHLPNPCTRFLDPRTAADFVGLDGLDAKAYVKAWDRQHQYKQAVQP